MGRLRLSYYLFTFLGSLAFERAIFVLFLEERGVSSQVISILQISLFLANLVMEVPTGLFADRYGKKKSLILGCGILAASVYLQYLAAPAFTPLLLSFLLYGLGFALISGSGAALLYENLLRLDLKDIYLGLSSRARFLGSIALGASMFLGGFLKIHSWEWVYLASTAAFLLAIIPLLFIPEMSRSASKENAKSILSFGQEALSFLPLVLPISLLHSVATPLFVFGQKLFASFGLPIFGVSSIVSLTEISGALIAIWLSHWQRNWSLKQTSVFCAASIICLLLLLHFELMALSLICYFSINLLSLALLNVSGNYFQQRISDSSKRASLLSFITFCDSIAIVLGYLWFGFWSERLSIHAAILSSVVFPIASLAFLVLLNRKGGK